MDTGPHDRRRERHVGDFLGIAVAQCSAMRFVKGSILPKSRTFSLIDGPELLQLANFWLKAKLRSRPAPMNGPGGTSHS